jgi:hypothetical protein
LPSEPASALPELEPGPPLDEEDDDDDDDAPGAEPPPLDPPDDDALDAAPPLGPPDDDDAPDAAPPLDPPLLPPEFEPEPAPDEEDDPDAPEPASPLPASELAQPELAASDAKTATELQETKCALNRSSSRGPRRDGPGSPSMHEVASIDPVPTREAGLRRSVGLRAASAPLGDDDRAAVVHQATRGRRGPFRW